MADASLDPQAVKLFWERVTRGAAPDDCWTWAGTMLRKRVPQFKAGDRTYSARVVSWTLRNGPVPPNTGFIPVCGAAACVNPAHLVRGKSEGYAWRPDWDAGRVAAEYRERVVLPAGRSGCWAWAGFAGEWGEPQFRMKAGGRRPIVEARRVSWEVHVGPIPAGHFVRNRRGCAGRGCTRPDHLELVDGTARLEHVRGRSARSEDGYGLPDPDAFWRRVDRSAGPGGCWPWRGCVTAGRPAGAVRVTVGFKRSEWRPPRRVAWELLRGPVPAGYAVVPADGCGGVLCVNPAHSRLVPASLRRVGHATPLNRDERLARRRRERWAARAASRSSGPTPAAAGYAEAATWLDWAAGLALKTCRRRRIRTGSDAADDVVGAARVALLAGGRRFDPGKVKAERADPAEATTTTFLAMARRRVEGAARDAAADLRGGGVINGAARKATRGGAVLGRVVKMSALAGDDGRGWEPADHRADDADDGLDGVWWPAEDDRPRPGYDEGYGRRLAGTASRRPVLVGA